MFKLQKRNYIWIAGLLFFSIAVFLFVQKNSFLYQDTIVKIVDVTNVLSNTEEGPNGEEELYYNQEITAVVQNGERKGERITLANSFSKSGVNDERYRKGDYVFVALGSSNGTIIGKKRDGYLAVLLAIFLSLLLYFNGVHGVMICVSLLINITLFIVALLQYEKGVPLIRISMILMIAFSILTLLFAGGMHKKTLVAILSTLLTTLLCYGIYEIVLHTNERLPYEMMDYIVNPKDLSDIFLAGILMGSLGAVCDVCISIAAGVAEIVEKKPDIKRKALIQSVREMGYDIMGTMINVLFFTYISGAIPIVVIKIKNGYTLFHMIHFQLVFELIRFLMGAIGIVLAIPVAGFCSVVLLHKDGWHRRREDKV
ncbi:MAG: YibE/F family protein [Eubacteriales bacterium]|nr:YibE/F family protein [Eubacteriales bacterium]